MPRRKFDTTQRGISDTHTDAPIATSICENKLVYAERIRTLRAAANLSQGELAEAMNLGRAAISNWETGRTRPDIANIPRLCNVLGITVAAFFSDTPEEAGWNDAERALMRNYRKLSAINQDLLSATAQTMVALEEQYPGLPKRPAAPKLTPEPARLELLELPYADDPVAARATADLPPAGTRRSCMRPPPRAARTWYSASTATAWNRNIPTTATCW